MPSGTGTKFEPQHERLLRETMRWAAGAALDEGRVRALRRDALLANHRRYRQRIPLYRKLADKAGAGDDASFDTIAANMLLPDGIFKSYPQALLDARDFGGMNAWLRTIFHEEIEHEHEHETIDEWLHGLEKRGVHAVYSSGTSGNLSFVPRDEYSWSLFREGPLHYAPLLLARRGVVGRWKAPLAALAGRTLSPGRFMQVFQRLGLLDFDGIFLNFRGGNQGIQLVGQELAKRVRKAHFLYPTEISATAIRALTRGQAGPKERQRTEEFLDATVRQKEDNYARMLEATREAIAAGQRLMVFGAPYLVKEFCDRILAGGERSYSSASGTNKEPRSGERLMLPAGSVVGYGGGWKSFDGEQLTETALLELIERATGVTKDFVVEAYSMTEIGAIMMKCEERRFHVPPHIETIILDDALEPVTGDDVTGILGVMDPFAVSYPGFLVTGDDVRKTTAPCPCGLPGDTFLKVGRAAGAEVKGCGGIMATVNA